MYPPRKTFYTTKAPSSSNLFKAETILCLRSKESTMVTNAKNFSFISKPIFVQRIDDKSDKKDITKKTTVEQWEREK